MRYGLEQEFFVVSGSCPDLGPFGPLPQSLTPDECGFLAEARGQPCFSIREAVFSLKADVYRLQGEAKKGNLILQDDPCLSVDRKVLLSCRRAFAKPLLAYQNLYGYSEHKNRNKKTAGIHISFSVERTIRDRAGKEIATVKEMFDWAQIFRKLDAAFAAEIKAAQRHPGFYELKQDGRIEYRSLPTNCDLMKIIEVLS